MSSRRLWCSCGAVVAVAFGYLLWVAPTALASHYRLPAAGLVSDAEAQKLNGQGIHTTVDLLEQTAPRATRRKLVRKTRISYVRLTQLATQCELLRIRGVGPSMVRLLQAGGVRHSGALRRLEPGPLLARLAAANEVHHITEVLPDESMVADWIGQAKRLPLVLEGIR